MAGGNVAIEDLTLVTDTDSPTVTVSDGNLTLRNIIIQGTGSGSRPAVEITGGTVDLGNADDPGGNTDTAHGLGECSTTRAPRCLRRGRHVRKGRHPTHFAVPCQGSDL